MSKTVIITGASSGIGKALTIEFLNRGFKVFAVSRRIEGTDFPNNKNLIKKNLDVSDYDAIEKFYSELKNDGISVDILINNAGYGLPGPALELPINEIEKEYRVNVFGALKLAQVFGKEMAKRRSGIIVNIGSVSGMLTTPFFSAYCSSKASINSISEALRMELIPFNVKVITVTPGAIVSNFGETAFEFAEKIIRKNSIYEKFGKNILERAKLSQQNATPVEKFVKKLIEKILSENPPAIFRYGKMSFLAWFLGRCVKSELRHVLLTKKFLR